MGLTETEELELLELEEQEALGSQAQPQAQTQDQSIWQATQAALGSRPELQPYGPASVPQGGFGPLEAAGQTLAAPMRIGQTLGSGPQILGEETAEGLGRAGVNPYVAATAGMVAANAPFMALPGGATRGRFLAPTVPTARRAAVQIAEREGIPLTRGEMTGSRVMAGTENVIEKTPMGAGPFEQFRGAGDIKMQTFKERLTPKAKEVFDIGAAAQKSMAARKQGMAATKNAMYEAVPENVNIPLSKSIGVADEIIQEQSKYLPTTRNSEIIALAKDVQSAGEHMGTGRGVTGGPEVQGVTRTIPGQVIPPSTVKRPSSLVSASGKPLSFKEDVPGRTIPESKEYGVKYSVGPEETFEPQSNYQLLKRLRETLTGKAQAARDAKNFALERDYLRLKSSVDQDIDEFVKTQNTPLGQAIGQEFAETYTKANAFARAYKRLFEGEEADLVSGLKPEAVVDRVFKKNSESAINRFHALVGDDAFKEAKAKWVNDLMESPNVAKELEKYEPGTLRSIFSKPELDEIQNYASVQGIRKTVQSVQGTQGSARSNIHSASYGGLAYGGLAALRGDVIGAAIGVGQYVAPRYAAKALTSEAARRGIQYTVPGVAKKALYGQLIDRIIDNRKQQ